MKKALQASYLTIVVLAILLSACGSATTPAPAAIPTNTILPTDTPQPTSTPQPTPMPGQVIIPLEGLDYGIPWLPMDRSRIPMVVYFGFNVNVPPFNVPEVRQAFAAALDTEVLTLVYSESNFYSNEVATRTVLPPETLSRDVSNEIGIPYDPALAKQLLANAGYTDPTTFPETRIMIVYFQGADYPGIIVNAANEAIRMWEQNLGVTVQLEVIGLHNGMEEQRQLIQSGQYQIFEYGVWAGPNDPDAFMSSMFGPDGMHNLVGYDNPRVTLLINQAANEVDPADRLPLYLELERILSEEELPIIPIFHCTVDGSQW